MREIERLEDIKNHKDRELVQLLQKLVQIPSWTDPKDIEKMKTQNENDVVDFLDDWIKTHTNFKTERQSLDYGRNNLIVSKGKPDLIFLAHTDTIGETDGAPFPLFDATIHDGKVWGRGTTDMKSGIATMTQALSLVPDANNVWAFFYADEEYDFLGMKGLVEKYSDLRPKTLVSSDGSDLKIGFGCRGLMEVRARVTGKSGHAAKGNGLNAIEGAIAGILEVRKHLDKYKHPIMGDTSLNLAHILGGLYNSKTSIDDKGYLSQVGQEGNQIADVAEFVLDIRPATPDLTVKGIVSHLEDYLKDRGYQFELVLKRHDLGAWYTEQKNVSEYIEMASEVLGGQVQFDEPGKTGYLDLQMYWEAVGRPNAIMFGGGKGKLAHKSDEHIEIKDLIKERDFFKKVLENHSKQV